MSVSLKFFWKKLGWVFWDRVSCVVLSPMLALVRDDPLFSASQVLWLKACPITARQEPTSKHCRFLFPEIPKVCEFRLTWFPIMFSESFLGFRCQRASSGISTNCTEVLVNPQGQAKFFLQTRYKPGKTQQITGQIFDLISLVYMHIKQIRQMNSGFKIENSIWQT